MTPFFPSHQMSKQCTAEWTRDKALSTGAQMRQKCPSLAAFLHCNPIQWWWSKQLTLLTRNIQTMHCAESGHMTRIICRCHQPPKTTRMGGIIITFKYFKVPCFGGDIIQILQNWNMIAHCGGGFRNRQAVRKGMVLSSLKSRVSS